MEVELTPAAANATARSAESDEPIVAYTTADFGINASNDSDVAMAIFELLASWGHDDPLYDVTGNGIVDADDLTALLRAWSEVH